MKLKIARHHNGLGDWWFVLAVLRWLRAQHPDVELIIDFQNAPRIVQDSYAASDLKYQNAKIYRERPDVALDHVVYNIDSAEPYMHGIARVIGEAIARPIVPERFNLPFGEVTRVAPARRRVAMAGHGKGVKLGGKEWGHENFVALSRQFMEHGFEVWQVGGPRDNPLPKTPKYLGASFLTLVNVLVSSRAFIGVENGLMVLAGFLRVPQVTIYNGAPGADRVDFEQHLKITEPIDPPEAFKRIQQWLG